MTTQYIDTRNPDITTEEAIALYNGTVKSYPQGWYDSEEDVLEYHNMCQMGDYQDALHGFKSDVEFHNPRTKNGAVVARYSNKRSRWEEFSMSVNKWENLTCSI